MDLDLSIHIPTDGDDEKIKGVAFIELSSGVNVYNIMNQFKGLEMGGQKLRINKVVKREGGRSSGGRNVGDGFGSGFGGGRDKNSSGFGGGKKSSFAELDRYGRPVISRKDTGFGASGGLNGINQKRDQQQSSFSSYQNGNNQPTKRSGGKAGGLRKDLNSSDEEWYPSQSW